MSNEIKRGPLGQVNVSGIREFKGSIVKSVECGQKIGLFKVMEANQWIELAKSQPDPVELFGEFWFLNEVCILFSDTNTGKSVLVV